MCFTQGGKSKFYAHVFLVGDNNNFEALREAVIAKRNAEADEGMVSKSSE
jgi:hypothetical protein